VSTSPQATIQRDVSAVTSSTTPFDIMDVNSTIHDLIIEYLTIDGNRQGLNSSSVYILLCGHTNSPPGSSPWIDLNLTNAGYNSSPSAYHGASVQYMNFINAPAYSLTLGAWGYVYSSTFQYARYGAIYEYSHNLITYNTIEYSGDYSVSVAGSDVKIQYNTLTQNHDEFPDAGQPNGYAAGGELFLADNISTNFTILNNVIDGNYDQCNSSTGCNNNYLTCNMANGCTVLPVTTTSATLSCPVPYSPPMNSPGIESHSPGGTYQDNYIYYHVTAGLYAANIDGSGITAVTGAFSSTTAHQAMTVINTVTGPYFDYNDTDGVLLNMAEPTGSNFAGTFTFSDLRSTTNGGYGFEWTMNGTTPGAVTLNWGSPSAACLTGNSSGAVGTMPSGYSGPTSTSTCP
jgi:hypothetical protein